ncbi:hypothetical protein BDV96DRAFT_605632 [Lophiotrema nucula]|uniref:Uncharacterized protein n=1 Tax=Lophiotrema nucula TaxID=690887 RepID=A0A6A5YQ98_9PLEO|nr:hypothetical protein BDV96DRAFT_605632 [Lophiotrema nucula]
MNLMNVCIKMRREVLGGAHESTRNSRRTLDQWRAEQTQNFNKNGPVNRLQTWRCPLGGYTVCERLYQGSLDTRFCAFDKLLQHTRHQEEKKYVTRDTLSDLVENSYCPLWNRASSGIGTGIYLENTPENVEISVIGNIDAQGVISVDDCKGDLHRVLDGCDGDGSTNPFNWKAGGEMTIGDWTYSLKNCTTDRLPLRGQRRGVYWKDVQQLGGHKGVDTSKWTDDFKYKLDNENASEWTVSMNLDLGSSYDPSGTVLDAMRAVENPTDPNNLDIKTGYGTASGCQISIA